MIRLISHSGSCFPQGTAAAAYCLKKKKCWERKKKILELDALCLLFLPWWNGTAAVYIWGWERGKVWTRWAQTCLGCFGCERFWLLWSITLFWGEAMALFPVNNGYSPLSMFLAQSFFFPLFCLMVLYKGLMALVCQEVTVRLNWKLD